MELIDRDEALATLDRLREGSFAGRGGVAVVGGPVAVGKTALLDEFVTRTMRAGGVTLTAAAAEVESALPLGVLAQFTLGAALPAQHRDRLDALVRDGAEAMASAAGPPGGAARLSVTDARIADRLCGALVELSADNPLAVVVDDVHHADAASLVCLGYLVRRIRDARIAVVFVHANRVDTAAPDFRLDVLRQPRSLAIELAPLSRAGVQALLATRLEPARAEAAAGDCFRLSAGNPLLVSGLLADERAAQRLARDGGVDTGAATVDGYVEAVLACLRRGGTGLLAAARGLAVLGGTGGLDRLLDRDAGQVAGALRELELAGILEGGRFRHPAAAAAVLADMDTPSRALLHERAARIGHADGQAPRAVAEHLRAAHSAAVSWAVPILDEAAREALAEGQVSTAIDYLRLACEACTDQPVLARLRTTLVRAQWRMSPVAPAQHLDVLLEAMEAGHLVGGDILVLVRALLWHGRVDEAIRVLAHFATSQDSWDEETLAELRATRQWMRLSFTPLLEHLPPADEGAAQRSAVGGTDVRHRLDAAAALDTVLTKTPSEQVVEAAERILRATRLEGMGMDAAESALLALTYADLPHRAAPWCDRLIEQAVARESPSREARLSAIRAEISMRQGDLSAAEQHARNSLELIPPQGWGITVGSSLGSLLTAMTAMGRHEDVTELVGRPVPDAMLQSRFGLHYVHARGRHGLATEDYGGALADFLYCGELMGRWGIDSPGLIPWRTDAADAYLRLGEKGRAVGLLEEQLARSDREVFPRAHGSALRLLGHTHELRQRPVLLRRAADILRTSSDRYALAQALCDLTMAYHELGEQRRATVIGLQAWSLAAECRADPLSRLMATERAEPDDYVLEARNQQSVVLTDAAQRVTDLVALGHTNREIAKKLFVTVSTVEQHLTRAYRLFNVTNRADLAMVLSARAAQTS